MFYLRNMINLYQLIQKAFGWKWTNEFKSIYIPSGTPLNIFHSPLSFLSFLFLKWQSPSRRMDKLRFELGKKFKFQSNHLGVTTRKNLCIKFHQQRSILKYSEIGELNAREKQNKIRFFNRNNQFETVTKSVRIRIAKKC